MKSGNLKFLEPSGPLQACNGTDLPLPLPYRPTYTHTINVSPLAIEWPTQISRNVADRQISIFSYMADRYGAQLSWHNYITIIITLHLLRQVFMACLTSHCRCFMYVNPVKPRGHNIYQRVSIINNSTFCPHSVFMILCGSENKQRLFLHTAKTDRF